jgi:hypothetical protein
LAELFRCTGRKTISGPGNTGFDRVFSLLRTAATGGWRAGVKPSNVIGKNIKLWLFAARKRRSEARIFKFQTTRIDKNAQPIVHDPAHGL